MDQKSVEEKNVRLYSILSYIGLLWLIGVLVKEKDNKTLKFHVGQGIILSILWFAIGIIGNAISLFTDFVDFVTFPWGLMSALACLIIMIPLCIFAFVLMIIGMLNASNGKEEPLPLIGQFSFYK